QLLELARQRLVAPRPRLQPLQPAIERLDRLPQLPVGVGQLLVAPLAPRERPAVKPVRWLPIGSVAFRPRLGLLPLRRALGPLRPLRAFVTGLAVGGGARQVIGGLRPLGARGRGVVRSARARAPVCQSLFLSMPTSSRFNASAAHAAMTPAAGETGPAAPAPATRADALGPGSSAARYSRLYAPGGRSGGRSSPGAGPR